MNTDTIAGGQTVVGRHRENLMGLPVVLLNAAFEAKHGDETGIVVPDVEALECAMAVARVMVPAKLAGNEIRFLRKVIGEKAVNLAKFLDVTAETFSRWENGAVPISTNPERILRLRVLHALRAKAPGVLATDDDILSMSFSSVRASTATTTLVFERAKILNGAQPKTVWCFLGTEQQSQSNNCDFHDGSPPRALSACPPSRLQVMVEMRRRDRGASD